MFSGKKILIGITGGIAAYKTAALIRTLRKENAEIKVVMTQAATHFVGPLTYETLSGNKVLLDLFASDYGSGTVHIDLARWADCMLICPATANIVAKLAHGIADDSVTTIAAAAVIPIIVCPAMNKEMYKNQIYQDNQKKLKSIGYTIVEPGQGELACGEEGWGRLAEEGQIISALQKITKAQDLQGLKVVVTAGRTEEAIDPVRFLTNSSTGKMGFSIADAAASRGAEVTLISGPSTEVIPANVKIHYIRSAQEMLNAVTTYIAKADLLIMAAAVADFRPKKYKDSKIKKNDSNDLILELEQTEDILKSVGNNKGSRIHIGFALETENEVTNAQKKLQSKNLDLIVINNPTLEGAGFGTNTNIVTLIDKYGLTKELPCLPKKEVADYIINSVLEMMKKNNLQRT